MAIEHNFYMDTTATRQELRDVLVGAGIGFEAELDMADGEEGLPDLSLASSPATSVTILGDLHRYAMQPDNGVVATLCVSFRDRRLYLSKPETGQDFKMQVTKGVMALLWAFLDADAYWLGWDAEKPMLLRRGGRLVLAEGQAKDNGFWDAERQPCRALVDLPYMVEPLGPWRYGPVRAPTAAE